MKFQATGFASAYDIWVQPAVRDAAVLFPIILWWFVFHYAVKKCLPFIFPHYHRLDAETRNDLATRTVSGVNGLLMSTAIPIFYDYVKEEGLSPYANTYTEIPSYRVYRVAVAAYFVWDIVICFYNRWDFQWKLHAVCSFIGTYCLMFPMCDHLASFYTGFFEGTNPLLHLAVILRVAENACRPNAPRERRSRQFYGGLATIVEYLFALLFFLFRVVGGTIVSYCCIITFCLPVWNDWFVEKEENEPPLSHSPIVLLMIALCLLSIQLLQYVWIVAIIKKGLGIGDVSPSKSKGGEKAKRLDSAPRRLSNQKKKKSK